MTLLANHSDGRTLDFDPTDVGYAPVTLPHSIEKRFPENLVDLEMFRAPV